MINKYKELRNKFLPKNIKYIFIAESPPSGGKYFYNTNGSTGEILFRSIIKCLFGDYKPSNKKEGLRRFADTGFLLVNPIYEPVDKLPDKEADRLILDNYSGFTEDLHKLIGENKKVKLILIKKNICNLLENKLVKDGFDVLNKGEVIPFPMHYHFNKFNEQVDRLLNS